MKINVKQFICDLANSTYINENMKNAIQNCLRNQGLECVDGKIVNVEENNFMIEDNGWYVCIKDYYACGNKRASKGDVVQAKRGMSMMGLNEGYRGSLYFREWTIDDAYDGQVLVSCYNRPFIYLKKELNKGRCACYCGLNCIGEFSEDKSNYWAYADGVKPATSDDVEKLFNEISKNGYEWLADRKVLNKKVISDNKLENTKPTLYTVYKDSQLDFILNSFVEYIQKHSGFDFNKLEDIAEYMIWKEKIKKSITENN